jgi:hypothetical protein
MSEGGPLSAERSAMALGVRLSNEQMGKAQRTVLACSSTHVKVIEFACIFVYTCVCGAVVRRIQQAKEKP